MSLFLHLFAMRICAAPCYTVLRSCLKVGFEGTLSFKVAFQIDSQSSCGKEPIIMTSQSRFRLYSWKHQLVLLTMAVLFSSCSTAAGMIPNTALPTPASVTLDSQAQSTQPPAPSVPAEPRSVATQLQAAVATKLPTSIPIQATPCLLYTSRCV